MRRRELLVSTGVAVTAGCIGGFVGGRWSEGHVRGVDFSVQKSPADTEVDAPPTVEFRPESSRVVVTGTLWVGSSSCNEAKLDDVSYHERDGRLDVAVTSGEKGGLLHDVPLLPVGCTADMSADAYELVVTFRGSFPKTVVAVEHDGEPERTKATKPVD
ncbi:hypothetical protein ZOD2009_12772 [Haladaptatus paucihalophilus DX253]|uniref:Lipoprotein n=1 Tax=Haladaptatus paucihalophilus DX253 TaxID=797209 RepID=E7QUR9_HALPU|nr:MULTISPECIES: hypothetical protein [Haladaptatus]EFW91726.1 hypothetical protein ZOD2009_12772 [Haladaptatus paucihalophilus DX253]GKZ12338.1 hypothetical protein HAL_02190 [Haladaptatus sp. T7]SHJ95982.1 hypothetical protein SAMN05444342_0076 [Haladaptatus paucihalophilus DX253]